MNATILESLSFEEQGAILFSSALFCVATVVFFAMGVWRVSLGKNVCVCRNCFCVTLMRVIWRRCCACRDLDKRLREHLKSDDDDDGEQL
jgi:hypothetical protein